MTIIKDHEPIEKEVNISLSKNRHLLLSGPNGIGKSTLLESIANGTAKGVKIAPNVKIGYYRQDFQHLILIKKCMIAFLKLQVVKCSKKDLRSFAAGFLITGDIMATQNWCAFRRTKRPCHVL